MATCTTVFTHWMGRTASSKLIQAWMSCVRLWCILIASFIDTDMTRALADDQREALQTQIPLGRLGQPGDIAATVAFLASDAGQYITGETIQVNGGLYMG